MSNGVFVRRCRGAFKTIECSDGVIIGCKVFIQRPDGSVIMAQNAPVSLIVNMSLENEYLLRVKDKYIFGIDAEEYTMYYINDVVYLYYHDKTYISDGNYKCFVVRDTKKRVLPMNIPNLVDGEWICYGFYGEKYTAYLGKGISETFQSFKRRVLLSQ